MLCCLIIHDSYVNLVISCRSKDNDSFHIKSFASHKNVWKMNLCIKLLTVFTAKCNSYQITLPNENSEFF